MSEKARAMGINHVALEVADSEEALAFYGRFLEFDLRSKSERSAFIDLGDQFLALSTGRCQPKDDGHHFGLVVDDKNAVRQTLEDMGVEIVSDRFLDFYDPWGNQIEIVGYQGIQFTKAEHILCGKDLEELDKTDKAIEELVAKGMKPEG